MNVDTCCNSGFPCPTRKHAATRTGVPTERIALVAAHAWDTHGAHNAGLTTGWVARLEGQFPVMFSPPDVTGDDLVAVIDALLSLPVPHA